MCQSTQLENTAEKIEAHFNLTDPLAIWTLAIQELALISREELTRPYKLILKMLNERQYSHELEAFPELWVQ